MVHVCQEDFTFINLSVWVCFLLTCTTCITPILTLRFIHWKVYTRVASLFVVCCWVSFPLAISCLRCFVLLQPTLLENVFSIQLNCRFNFFQMQCVFVFFMNECLWTCCNTFCLCSTNNIIQHEISSLLVFTPSSRLLQLFPTLGTVARTEMHHVLAGHT